MIQTGFFEAGIMPTGEDMKRKNAVTVEEKKKWLKRVSWAVQDLADLLESKQAGFNKATSVTASYSAAVVASTKDPHKFDGLALLDACIADKERQIADLQREILQAVLTVKDIPQRKVLRELYINCRTIPEAAEVLHYSERHVKRLHAAGVDNIRITRTMLNKSGKKKTTTLPQ